jgi:transposase-like protein
MNSSRSKRLKSGLDELNRPKAPAGGIDEVLSKFGLPPSNFEPPPQTEPPANYAPAAKSEPAANCEGAAKTEPAARESPTPLHAEPAAKFEPAATFEGVEIRSHYAKVLIVVLDELLRTLEPATGYVYLQLYRLSYGFGKTTCEVSVPKLAERCGVAQNTIRKGLKQLAERRLARRVESDLAASIRQERGSTFVVSLPPGTPAEALGPSRSAAPSKSAGASKLEANKEKSLKDRNKPLVYQIREIGAQIHERHRKEANYSRADLREDVKAVCAEQGIGYDDALIEEALGKVGL